MSWIQIHQHTTQCIPYMNVLNVLCCIVIINKKLFGSALDMQFKQENRKVQRRPHVLWHCSINIFEIHIDVVSFVERAKRAHLKSTTTTYLHTDFQHHQTVRYKYTTLFSVYATMQHVKVVFFFRILVWCWTHFNTQNKMSLTLSFIKSENSLCGISLVSLQNPHNKYCIGEKSNYILPDIVAICTVCFVSP